MNIHLQILATGFYGMSQAEALAPTARRAYEALGRFWQFADWIVAGTYRRNLARERARDVRELTVELRKLGFETQYARQLAKVIVADRRLHSAMWTALLGSSRWRVHTTQPEP